MQNFPEISNISSEKRKQRWYSICSVRRYNQESSGAAGD